MYCSTCGQKIAEHLNYCNSCGARLEKALVSETNATPPHLIKGLSVVLMMGFVAFVGVLKMVLDSPRLDMPATVFILVAYLGALTMITSMYFRHMSKGAGVGRDRSKRHGNTSEDYISPVSFNGPNTNQLGESTQQPIGSVTDSTTRTLDEVMVERR